MAAIDADTVYLVSLPAGHNFPLACPGILGTLLAGGRVVMLPSPEPARAFATIAAEGVTHTAVVPAVAGRWLDHAAEHGARRSRVAAGAAGRRRPAGRRAGPHASGRCSACTLQQVFGMAEGLLNYTRLDDPDDVVCTTQGRPMCPDDEVRLVDELDQDVPDGRAGLAAHPRPLHPARLLPGRRAERPRLHRRTAGTAPATSAAAPRRATSIVEGRDKDMINRGGEKISAEEVENLVYQLPAVAQVAAVAMPDPQLGERVCVYVVPRPRRDGHPRARSGRPWTPVGVARFKLPERLVLVDELASTKVGKIDKKALRADIAARLAAERAGAPA